MKPFVVLVLGIAATSALAETTAPSASKPDAGFFRPSDLPAPQIPLVVTDPAVPATPQAQPVPPDPAVEIRKAEEVRRTETEMDRIERENERARRQPPAPVT